MPARLTFKCTDGGSLDGFHVDATCTTDGQLSGSTTAIAPRVAAGIVEAFPANGSVVMATGKCLYRGVDSTSLSGLTGAFVLDTVGVVDSSLIGLDLDVFIGVGDTSAYNGQWNATPAEGGYAYMSTFSGGLHTAVIKIRSADYTTQYSGAGTPVNKVATKLVAIPFPVTAGQTTIQCAVISAGTSTATLAQYAVSLTAMIRLGG